MNDDLDVRDLCDGIYNLILSRAPVNALSATYLKAIEARMNTLIEASEVRAIVISSAFKTFSAGMDLKNALTFDGQDQQDTVDGLNGCYLRLFTCPKPLVTAVDGAAIAGGLFFVLTADHRVATPRATFGLAEVRVGVDFPVAPLEIARAMLSPNDLRRLMQSGYPYDAETAQKAGIVDEIVEADALMNEATAAARKLAAIPSTAYASVKRQIRGAVAEEITRALPERRGDWFGAETKDAMERMMRGAA